MPVEVEDEFIRQEEGKAFADNLLATAQCFFAGKLSYTLIVSQECIWCWMFENTPKKHFFSRTHKKSVAAIYYCSKGNVMADITVYTPTHKEVAMAMAAVFPLVYTNKIKVTIEHPT